MLPFKRWLTPIFWSLLKVWKRIQIKTYSAMINACGVFRLTGFLDLFIEQYFLGIVNAAYTTQPCLTIWIPSIAKMFCFLSRAILSLKSDMWQNVLFIISSSHHLIITYTAMLVILLPFSSSLSREIMRDTSLPGPSSKINSGPNFTGEFYSIHSLIQRVSSKRTSLWNPMPKQEAIFWHTKNTTNYVTIT